MHNLDILFWKEWFKHPVTGHCFTWLSLALERNLLCAGTRNLGIMTVLNCYCSLTEQAVPSYPFLFLFSVSQLTKFAVCHFFENHNVWALQVGLLKNFIPSHWSLASQFFLTGECSNSSLKSVKTSHPLPKGTHKARPNQIWFLDALSNFFKNVGTLCLVRPICYCCR